MSFIVVDVEADGPIPAEFSMVCFGAVLLDDALDNSFYGQLRPISDRFVPEALAVSGFSREQHLTFDDPKMVMETFAAWPGPTVTDGGAATRAGGGVVFCSSPISEHPVVLRIKAAGTTRANINCLCILITGILRNRNAPGIEIRRS